MKIHQTLEEGRASFLSIERRMFHNHVSNLIREPQGRVADRIAEIGASLHKYYSCGRIALRRNE